MSKNKTISMPFLILTCIWFAVVTCNTTVRINAYAENTNMGMLYVEGEGHSSDFILHIKNSLYQSDVQIPFDGSAQVALAPGSYSVSCENVDENGQTLVFENNTFEIAAGEDTVVHVTEGTAAKLYLRPTLFEGYGGIITVTLTGTDGFNKEYTVNVPRYAYDYAEWSDSFYWAEFDLPEGTYEVTSLTFEDGGRYYRCYVKDKTLETYNTWSGMLYMTVLDVPISADEAGIVYTEDELPEETEATVEAAETPTGQENETAGINMSLIILAVGLSACMLTGVFMLLAAKKTRRQETQIEEDRKEQTDGRKK